MAHRFHVAVVEHVATDEIPARFGEAALRELVTTLGGEVVDDEPVVDAIARTFGDLGESELAERLLEAVLTEPPIPAYCDALVRAMQDPATAPWRTHELLGDRVWLWYAHRLLSLALPDRYPPPLARRVRLEATPLDEAARPPGRRTPAHDRTAFVARLLAARPGALVTDAGGPFDVLWSVEIGERRPLDPDEVRERGATIDAAGGATTTAIDAWLPDGAVGALAPGDAWTAEA